MTQQRRAPRPITGWHVAAIFVTFFGVVVAVNVTMARLASSTFGGVVVDNSYVASQHFNRWLDEARAGDALGWKAQVARGAPGEVTATLVDDKGQALTGAQVRAVVEHPLGQRPQQHVELFERAPGVYAARLAPGRWRIRLTVSAQGQTWRTLGDVQ